MAEQQQQPAGGQVQTASSARVGLARSRHALGNDDETSNKKQKGAAPSFARDWIKKVQGKPHCTHCNESVSTNITRAKLHLLKCRKFLESEAAQAEADNGNKEVQQALLEHSSR
jgi:arginyl-tRNA--protein-N-Asp/Glu arginylyltransferase